MRIETKVASGAAASRAQAAVAALGLAPRPDFLAAYFTAGLDAEGVAAALAALGPRALHGGTSCRGVLSGAGMSAGPALGAFAIHDPTGDYGTEVVETGGDPRDAARRATLGALQRAGRQGEMPDLLWLTATPGGEEAVLAGIQDVVGPDVPILGGTAADDRFAGGWRVIGAAGARRDGGAVSVLFPSRPIAYAFQSGYAPTGERARVSAVDGRRLVALDGRPAADVYAEWSQLPALAKRSGGCGGPDLLGATAFAPFGRAAGCVVDVPYYLLTQPTAVHADGSIELLAAVEAGDELVMMRGLRDGLVGRAGRVARQSLELARHRAPPLGALLIYCGGGMMAVRDEMDEIASGITAALGGAPFLGLFSFGEQGCFNGGGNRHGNLMVACVSFGV